MRQATKEPFRILFVCLGNVQNPNPAIPSVSMNH
jgi:hypothetical protein